MSSYGSNHSGYLHPSQYPPNPPQQHQQQQIQPPYPTTPGPAPGHQSAFYPPPPQNQPMYSTSPASPWQQPNYSSSAPQYPFYSSSPGSAPAQPFQHRRSSSTSQSGRPQFTQFTSGTAPIAIPSQQQSQPYGWGSQQEYNSAMAPRHGSHGSHHSHHHHDHHNGDEGEGKWELDEETLRGYERRYAKERKMERRPTLGGSVMSMVRALGGKRE